MVAENVKMNSKQVLLLGLAGSGKTLLLKKLMDMKATDVVDVAIDSTLGFNNIELDLFNAKLTLWDLGGDQISRSYWPTFYRNLKVDIVIFVICLSDEDNLNKSLKELLNCINEEELKGAKFFVIFNYIVDEKDRKNFLETKYKEEFEKKELLIQEIKENVIHDIDNRMKHEIFDISKLKQGENKTNELLEKMFEIKLNEKK